MNSIEQQAINTYQENLEYLKEKQPNLFHKINVLNQAIEASLYTEKYSLEYKNTYFDILEISSNNYLFNQDSNMYAQKLASHVNYKKSESVLETFYNIKVTEKDLTHNKIPIESPLFAAAELLYYANEVTSKDDEMKYIDKYIFCGVGLGLHISKIQNKINASRLLIVEENLELFRLSLFTTNYKTISLNTILSFSVMENDTEFKTSFDSFFTKGYNNNKYLKYSLFSQNEMSIIKRIQHFIITSQHLTYPYSRLLSGLLKAPEYLIEKYNYLDVSKIHSSNSPLSDKPVLLIASGPSLDYNQEWLIKNRDNFVIISAFSSIVKLYGIGVKPDIVVHIDPQTIAETFLNNIDFNSYLNNCSFIFSSVIAKNVLDRFPKERVFIFESLGNYKQNFGTLTVPSVGETIYALSLTLGVKDLYLLGLDLALDPNTKRTHSTEHHYNKVLEESTTDNEDYTSIQETISYIKGNFIKQVPITPLFRLSVAGFNHISETLLCQNQKVYNLNNGAYLNGTIPKRVEEIDTNRLKTIDKDTFFKSSTIFLQTISENSLNQQDLIYLDVQIKEAKRLLAYVEEFDRSIQTSNYEIYMKNFYILSSEMINLHAKKQIDIHHIMYSYLQYISSHIFDIFNTKNLKNNKRHLKKVNNIFIKGLIKILNLYITTMSIYKVYAEK